MAETVDIDAIVPEDEDDKAFFFKELENLVEFHRQRRINQYQAMCRRYAGDVDGDDAILVDGDGRGKSRVEPLLDVRAERPPLNEIPNGFASFRVQLRHIFSPQV